MYRLGKWWIEFARISLCASALTATGPAYADAEPEDPQERRSAIMPPSISSAPKLLNDVAWVPLGPIRAENSRIDAAPHNQISGAIHGIAAHPTQANVMFVGTVNGGIWRTHNATDPNPVWLPLTDQLPSLSIAKARFDPLDASGQTLIAGTGRWSNYGLRGDDEVGIYYSTNGGVVWSHLGSQTLLGKKIVDVAARGPLLLVATWDDGLFVSRDRGQRWSLMSGTVGLPSGGIAAFAEDRNNPQRLAVVTRGGRALRSDNLGSNWADISTGLAFPANPAARITFGPGQVLYAAAISDVLVGLYRSDNAGASWTPLDTPPLHPKRQGVINTAMVAHPTDPHLLYAAGDGAFAHYLINSANPRGNQVRPISGGSFGKPYEDAREMRFSADGSLFLADDGGIFRLSLTQPQPRWYSLNSNLVISEVHNIAFDTVSGIYVVGTQDNGTQEQVTSDGVSWRVAKHADGGDVQIDVQSLMPSHSVRYTSMQNLMSFDGKIYASNNANVGIWPLPGIPDPQFVTPIELNRVFPRRMLVGGRDVLYEAQDAIMASPYLPIPARPPLPSGANRGAMSYGATDNPSAIYVGKGAGVLKRVRPGTELLATAPLPSGAQTVNDVSMHVERSAQVVAIDNDQVFFSKTGGEDWIDVTFELPEISALDFRTVEFFSNGLGDCIALGTRSGVYLFRFETKQWAKLGTTLPDVPVHDLHYVAAQRLLIAGTLGRGAWRFQFPAIASRD